MSWLPPVPLVIKLGGAAGIDPAPLLDELAALERPWVLVHGGNAELDDVSRRLGHEPRFVTSPSGHTSRVTDEETIGLMQMVYRGRRNNELVLGLQQRGVNAIGLSGVDGGLLRARRKPALRIVENGRTLLLRGDLTGTVHTANVDLLRLLTDQGMRVVATPPALADTGEAVNVDGDRAAACIAAALGADLVNLSNVPGLLRDVDDPDSLVRRIDRDRLDEDTYAKGRFRKKLMAAREALDGGARRVVLATANTATPIASALDGQGTVIA